MSDPSQPKTQVPCKTQALYKKAAAYKKPMDQIINFSELALTHPIKTARSFSVLGEIPPTTGYRVVEAMESRDYIARDSAGYFTRGSETLRVALRAWGVGALYLACEPVLNQLNEEARLTAFLGIRVEDKLFIGPLVPGSGADQAIPPLNAVFTCDVTEGNPAIIETDIHCEKKYIYHSSVIKSALFKVICNGINHSQAVIGVLLTRPPGQSRDSMIASVDIATHRMQDSLVEPDG